MENDVSSEISLDRVGLREHILTLTESQKNFVRLILYWHKSPRKILAIVSGGPGTGKTFVVKNTLKYVNATQMYMSYTARSAQALGGRTIHSTLGLRPFSKDALCTLLEKELAEEENLQKSIEKSKDIIRDFNCSSNPYIIVVDEVSMVTGWFMYWIIHFFMKRTNLPLLFICMGDPHQLNPVCSIHNLFSISFSEWKTIKIHLRESKRFVPEYNEIIKKLRDFVDKENETGIFAFICQHFPVKSIDSSIVEQANRAMASTNERVNTFNSYYIKYMVSGTEIKVDDKLILKRGCLVYVTSNYCSNVKNGTQLIFKRLEQERIVCEDPVTKKEIPIWRDSKGVFNLDLGFASTIHKYQGETIDDAKIIIHLDGNRNLNLVYTALSRVRQMDQILAIEL